MNILEKTKELIKKHNLTEKLTFNPFKEARVNRSFVFEGRLEFQGSHEKSEYLQKKYESRIPSGWYGIDLYEAPIIWLNALEEFLTELEKDSPEFEICQLKLKWGSFRGYMWNLSEEAEKSVDLLEEVMRDENLIY